MDWTAPNAAFGKKADARAAPKPATIPSAGDCVIDACRRDSAYKDGGKAFEGSCRTKETAIAEYNALGIPGMPPVTELRMLPGRYVNQPYTLPDGQRIRFRADDRVYLVNRFHKAGSDRCFVLIADEAHLPVCEYGENGANAEIIVYKKRRI